MEDLIDRLIFIQKVEQGLEILERDERYRSRKPENEWKNGPRSITDHTLDDLDQIAGYISKDTPRYTAKFIPKVFDEVSLLRNNLDWEF